MDPKNKKQGQCGKCMSNLISVLESINSRPKALLDAMGVVGVTAAENSNSNDPKNKSFWQVAKDGSGVRINIPQTKQPIQESATIVHSARAGFGGGTSRDNRPHRSIHGKKIENNTNRETVMSKDSLEPQQESSSQDSSFGVLNTFRDHLSGGSTSRTSQTVATSSHSPSPTETDAIDDAKKFLSLRIDCIKCGTEGPEGNARAYVKGPNPLSIILCSNRLHNPKDIEEVLVHELIHVYDVHARKWDLTDCNTLAKSEVRAAREAECADTSFGFTKRYCVRDKARLATRNMFPEAGGDCVGKVFEEAMKDYTPFISKTSPEGAKEKKINRQQSGTIRGRVYQSSYKH